VLDKKGLSLFDSGEIATTSCRGTFDTKKGFQGYTSMLFEDGPTPVMSWKGPTSQFRPASGKFWEYTIEAEAIYSGMGVVQDGNIITCGICPVVSQSEGLPDCNTELTQAFITALSPKRGK
jgi:hypothetical protein